MGVVLNRPSEALAVEAVPQLEALVEAEAPLWVGGPVEPSGVVVLAEFTDPAESASIVVGDVGFIPADGDAALLAASIGRCRVFAGYSGWAPGQLEAELEESAWIVEPARPEDVFADGDLWGTVLRRKGGEFRLIATMPPDPTLN
jgi:putative transcriptional regulator